METPRATSGIAARKVLVALPTAHLAFSNEPRIGGAEVQVRIVCEGLAARGHRVYLACDGAVDHPEVTPIPWQHLGRELRRLRPDVAVATIGMRQTVAAALACRRAGVPFVYRLSNSGEAKLEIGRTRKGPWVHRQIFSLMLRFATSRIWCQHEGQRADLEERGFHKQFVVANFAPDRRCPPPSGGAREVLWIGRYDAVKRPELFLEIARRSPRWRHVMILPGAPAGFTDAARELPHLQLHGYVPPDELPAHYARARVLVNTSVSEGFPNTFIEAACQGTPLVTLGVDPGGFFGRYGHGEAVDTPAAASAAIDRLFADATVHGERSAAARCYFEEIHDLERNFGTLERRLFESLGTVNGRV